MSVATRAEPSLTASAFWLVTAKTVAFFIGFVLPLLLVRRLSQYDFGLYKQAFLVVATGAVILPFGFHISAFYFLPREPERKSQIILNIVLFHFFTSGIASLVLVLWPGLLVRLIGSPEMAHLSPLIGITLFVWVTSSFLDTVAIANGEPKLSTVFIVGAQLTKTGSLLIAAVLFGTVQSLLIAATIHGTIQTCVMLAYMQKRFPGFLHSFNWQTLRMQLAYALPFCVYGLLGTLSMDVHNYFVANRFGSSLYAVYAIGCSQIPLIGLLVESVGAVMLARVSYLQSQGDRQGIATLTARVMRKLGAIYVPSYVFLLTFGREFIIVLFTRKYIDSYSIFAINITFILLSMIITDPITRAYASERQFVVKVQAAVFAVMTTILWAATDRLGLTGTITVVVAAHVLGRLAVGLRVIRILHPSAADLAPLRDLPKITACALIAALAAHLVRTVWVMPPLATLAVGAAVFSGVYIASILTARVITDDEKQYIQGQLARVLHSS